jgi:hypothetical protein
MGVSVTTSNDGYRNPHAPFGFTAARGHLLRCRSSEMYRIAVVAAPRIRPRSALNAALANTRTGS